MRLQYLLIIILLPITSQALNLNEYLLLVKTNDAEVEKILNQSMKLRFNKELSMPNKRILFSIKDEFGIQPDSDKTTSRLSAVASKEFSSTGTDINLSFTSNDLTDRKEQVQSLVIEQDLIRNSFGVQNRKLEEVLSRENEIIKLQTEESFEDYLLTQIFNYLEFQLAFVSYNTSKKLYNDSLQLQKEVLKRKSKSIADSVDVERVRLQVLDRKKALLDREQTLNSIKIQVKRSIAKLDHLNDKLTPSGTIPYINDKTNYDNQLQEFLSNGRSLKILKLSQTNTEQRVWIQNKDLLPEAKLLLGYSIDDSQRFTTQTNREETLVGLSLEFSLGDSVNKAEIKQAEFNKAQAKLQHKIQSEKLKSVLYDLKSQIQIHRQKMKVLEQKIASARKLVRGEMKRFKNGRSSLETIIESENILADTEFEVIAHKIQMAKAVAEWKSLTDSLLSEYL